MSYSCKILLDSISETGKRLTTMEITFPRIVLAEFNTHRMFSRNSASSRAIPFKKQLEKVRDNPFVPEQFPIDGKGMQPKSYLRVNSNDHNYAVETWLNLKDTYINVAEEFYYLFREFDETDVHIHKQLVNRLLEPFMWHTVIVTATEWDNFFKLRTHSDAQYEIKRIADLMYDAYHAFDNLEKGNTKDFISYGGTINGKGGYDNELLEGKDWSAIRPQRLKVGEWHCPLVYGEDDLLIKEYIKLPSQEKVFNHPKETEFIELKKLISTARCARVSYLNHDGKRNIEEDLKLGVRLRTSGHWSPFEHVATPYFVSEDHNMYPRIAFQTVEQINSGIGDNIWSGNFLGWKQYRKEFSDENCTNFRKEN